MSPLERIDGSSRQGRPAGGGRTPHAGAARAFRSSAAGLNPLEQARRFFSETIWEDERSLGRVRRAVYMRLRVLTLSFWNFQSHGAPTRAAALTYSSLLSLVPILAVGLALFNVFGGLEDVRMKVQDLIVEYIAPGLEQTVKQRLTEAILKVQQGAKANAILATLLLFFTVIRNLSNLESTFNAIVGVKRGRSLASRIAVYWAVATLGPVLVGASVAMTTTLKSSAIVRWLETRTSLVETLYHFSPWLLTCLGFAVVYLFLPNAKMKPRAALTGGLLAGLTFEVAKRAFTNSAVKLVSNYNEIYGSIATLFVFLFWLYISWMILLVGLELVVAMQSATTHRKEQLATAVSQKLREVVALRVVAEVGERFHRGAPPPSIDDLATALEVPERLLHDVVGTLEAAGLLHEVDTREDLGYVPARTLSSITAGTVLDALREEGTTALSVRDDPKTRYVREVLAEAAAAASEVFRRETLAHMVERLASEKAAGPEGKREPGAAEERGEG